MRIQYFCIVSIFVFLGFLSCKKESDDKKSLNSKHFSTESHHTGDDCMGCHSSDGNGEYNFTIAGTVYDSVQNKPFPNATIRIYSGMNGQGTLLKTLEVDGFGNFYTTDEIDFSKGVYTSVQGNKSIRYMQQKATVGQCSACHGIYQRTIYTD